MPTYKVERVVVGGIFSFLSFFSFLSYDPDSFSYHTTRQMSRYQITTPLREAFSVRVCVKRYEKNERITLGPVPATEA